MALAPYLFFNGQCRDALTFYGEVFGAEPVLLDATGMPAEFDVPEARKGWIMHGQVAVEGGTLMASDNTLGTSEPMAGAALQLTYATAAEAKAVFDRLAEGGAVTMAWAPTFWCAGFGALTDRFGIRWLVGCDEAPAG